MPASLAVRAHWSVSQPVGLNRRDVLDPGRPLLAGEGAQRPADEHAPLEPLQFLRPLVHVHHFGGGRCEPAETMPTQASHLSNRGMTVSFS